MNEPILTIPNPTGTGRPLISEEQYGKWFDDLAPFFKLGETLNAAIDDAGLQRHRTALYDKVGLNDWFADKMRSLQAIPGKLANNILVKRLMAVDEKIKQGLPVTEDEMKDVKFVAEKHRSAQPYFVTRVEKGESDDKDLGRIIDPVEINYVVPEEVKAPEEIATNPDPLQANMEATPSVVETPG